MECDEISQMNNIAEDGEDEGVSSPCNQNPITIEVGMEFHTIEEVHMLYQQFAKHEGFAVIRRNSREKVVQFSCHREGMPRKKRVINTDDEGGIACVQRNTKSGKVGCRASLYCSFNSTSKVWYITKFENAHNHEMVSPKSLKYIRGHKNLTSSARSLSVAFDSHGIPVGRVPDILYPSVEESEFTKKDCYNYMGRIRNQILDVGDAHSIYLYCSQQQELNPDFRYAIQVDEYDRMKNFFWIDPRSRRAYELFGDVISFDTTYRTNKYNMPFAPFMGIDNHMHSILFGCALLQDETEETFEWLFSAWLHAMNGKAPLAVITDQDMAIINAVAKVFPSAHHRLCIWHICKKFPERLSHVYHERSRFKQDLTSCIHGSLNSDQFEQAWERLVEEYNLHGNTWLSNLYSIRHMWVPVFSKHVFFGGLNSTQRSESINSFFDAFVHSGTTLKEFVNKFGHALDRRYETFRKAEFDSRHKVPILTLGMGIEEHAASIYTSEIFRMFHVELSSSLSYSREIIVEGNSYRTYKLHNRKSKCDVVLVDYILDTYDAKCECKLFESKGLLCRHILLVLFDNNVERIPVQYILPRWMKDIGRKLWEHPVACIGRQPYPARSLAFKEYFDDLSHMGNDSEIVFEHIQQGLSALTLSVKDKYVEVMDGGMVGSSNPTGCSIPSEHEPSFNIRDPILSQTKGRRKTTSQSSASRIRSGIEIASDHRVKCSICNAIGHNRRTCINNTTLDS